MIIILQISIIVAFLLVTIYMMRRRKVSDEIAALNKRVRMLEQRDRRRSDDPDGPLS